MNGAALDETDLSGNVTNEYVFFGGKRVARRDSSSNVFYYFGDHLGSSREIVEVGQTSACYDADFAPYGGEIAVYTNSCSQNYKFTGKERDAESGLDDFGARYYTSSFNRFVSPDWAAKPTAVPYAQYGDPQSLNLYGYVRNNPLSRADADGHCPDACAVEGGTALVVIGVAAVVATDAYFSTPSGQRSLNTFTSAASASISNSVSTIKSLFSKTKSSSNPFKGKPGSTSTTHKPDGSPKQAREYGADGYPKTDVDYDPHHGAPDPHAHDWGRPSDGSPPTADDRGVPRDVQPSDPKPSPPSSTPQNTPPNPTPNPPPKNPSGQGP